jgi:D-alanine-D-alanine ligase-like ATP-grasp enzyme
MQLSDKKRIGILRGGNGEHYENSLKKGGDFLSHILENFKDKYKPIDIFIDKNDIWHVNSLPIKPTDLIHKVDLVWNLSHPKYGQIIKNLSIPHIGSDHFFSTLEQSRKILEEHMKKIGVKMPRHLILPIYQKDFDGPIERYAIKKAKEVHEKFSSPWIVKSLTADSNIGVHVAETFPELVNAIQDVLQHGVSILVEEFIAGKIAFVHQLAGFRGEDFYTFPFGKYSKEEKEKLNNASEEIYKNFDNLVYLKSNFVLHPKRGIFLTSLEFHPDLEKNSHLNNICESVGAKMHHIVEHLIESSL